jgi:hypothetical protein
MMDAAACASSSAPLRKCSDRAASHRGAHKPGAYFGRSEFPADCAVELSASAKPHSPVNLRWARGIAPMALAA